MPTDTVIADSELGTGQFVSRNARLMRNYRMLDRQYSLWDTAYREISDYIAIGRGRFINQGGKPNQRTKAARNIINPTAPEALHMLGAGLHGGLSSPARPWFQYQFNDPDMNKFKPYRTWLDDCEKVMYSELKSSAFYTIVHGVYEEIGGFGTGSLLLDDKVRNGQKDGFLFYDLTAGDYRFTVGTDKLCSYWCRKYRQQASEVVKDFGEDRISDKVKALLANNPFEWVDIIHTIEPNQDYDPDKLDSKAYNSIYFEAKEQERRLSEGGYYEMPAVTPRWQALSNEAYGWGPGMDALGLSKAIQRSEQESFIASDKALSPPQGVPSSMADRMLDLSAGAKNVYDPTEGPISPLMQIDLNALSYYDAKIAANEERIRRLFFNELFLMIAQADRNMTATEVLAKNEEKMLMVGPTIERLEYEFLDPILTRGFNMQARQGKLPPPPQELTNAEYKIDYISILAQAQKLINSQTLQGYLGIAERVAAVDPTSIDKTDWDKFLDEAGNTVSLPAKIIRSEDEVNDIRDQQAQKQAEAEQLAMEAEQVDQLKKLGETPTTGGSNALADIQSQVGNA